MRKCNVDSEVNERAIRIAVGGISDSVIVQEWKGWKFEEEEQDGRLDKGDLVPISSEILSFENKTSKPFLLFFCCRFDYPKMCLVNELLTQLLFIRQNKNS